MSEEIKSDTLLHEPLEEKKQKTDVSKEGQLRRITLRKSSSSSTVGPSEVSTSGGNDTCQKSDLSVKNSSEERFSNTNQVIASSNVKEMLMNYGREAVCILALILTTYATFNGGAPKLARPPSPVSFFQKDCLVKDWPTGDLDDVQAKVSASELSLVLFYAPWCGTSQLAREPYENTARLFYKDIFFAAVNCWQPGGECRLQYSKVQLWPILMAYYPRGVAVQYRGQWSTPALTKFIFGLLQPVIRILSPDDLLELTTDNYAVVVGFFNTSQLRKDYQTYFEAAIKWLEKDPYQDIKFAVVTGKTVEKFNITDAPAIRLYLWNEIRTFSNSTKWTQSNIVNYVAKEVHYITSWLNPVEHKSGGLLLHAKSGPLVIMFSPRDYYFYNMDTYHMIKQVAMLYFNCKNDSTLNRIALKTITSQRNKYARLFISLKSKCLATAKGRLTPTSQISFVNILNNSKHYSNKLGEYCFNDKNCKDNIHNKEDVPHINEDQVCDSTESRLYDSHTDIRSVHNLATSRNEMQCKRLLLAEEHSGNVVFRNNEINDINDYMGLSCKYNRSLTFLLLDSLQYSSYSENFGFNILTKPQRSSVVIVDSENDSTYQLKGDINTSSIMQFIKDFHSDQLERQLRTEKYVAEPIVQKDVIVIKDINSKVLRTYIEGKQKTLLVLFYSTQCALCNVLSQTLLTIAKIFEKLNMDFYRVDADKNDFPWIYSMEAYPVLVIFPNQKKFDTKIFPNSMDPNLTNVLGFIIANLGPVERLHAILESCEIVKNCISIFRKEISNDIFHNLRAWRHIPYLRTEILRRLQILHKIYLLTFQMDNSTNLNVLRYNIALLYKIWQK